MALKFLFGMNLGVNTKDFLNLCEYVARPPHTLRQTHRRLNTFAHESGIHADGVLKYPGTYEVFSPEEVGLQRQIIIGKHSGSNAVKMKFVEYGIDLSSEEANDILALVRSAAVELKRPLFDKELMYIYEDYLYDIKRPGKDNSTGELG